MIKLESAHIEEVRGIRKLDLDLRKETFAISGPNGSGKSGVTDAIEFGLTGDISRLSGRGTKGLSVSEHGPHVDKTKFPDAAFVTLKVSFPELGKSASITRKVASPKKPVIEPDDQDIKDAFAEIADHPEVTLSRREILRFILVEPTKRSEEIQTILKLDQIGQTRSALNTTQNRLQTAHNTATAEAGSARDALTLHLRIATPRSEDVLEAVNKRRALLGLSAIEKLAADTQLDAGLSVTVKPSDFNKDSALRDLKALSEAVEGVPGLAQTESAAILADLERLEKEPELFAALQRRAFIEKGLELVDGVACPLCDTRWADEQHLRDHLKEKLAKSAEAQKLQESLLRNAQLIANAAIRIGSLIPPVQTLARKTGGVTLAQRLADWKADLESLKATLATVEGVSGLKERLDRDWVQAPEELPKELKDLTQKTEAQPDQSATLDAQTFLTTAQLRLTDYRQAMKKTKSARDGVSGCQDGLRDLLQRPGRGAESPLRRNPERL